MRRVWTVLLIAASGLSAQALKLDALDALAAKAKESVNMTIPQELLKIAFPIVLNDAKDPKAKDLAAALAGLRSISIRQFEFNGKGQYKLQDLDPIRAQLSPGAGWSKIISAMERDELSEIYTKTEQGRIVGIAIISAEDNELAVVAIDGPIDLAALTKMGGAFGIPDIGALVPKQNVKQDSKQDKKGKEE